MKKYTYQLTYTSYEESEDFYFMSDIKYSLDDLKQILHDAIIKYVTRDEQVNFLDWESILDTLYSISPVIKILEEEYDLTRYTPEHTEKLFYWGWSQVSAREPESCFKNETPEWQTKINEEVGEILKNRPAKPYSDGFIGR